MPRVASPKEWVYIMSEKAVGTDWKHSSIPTMRHAAGCRKYTNLDKYNEELQKKKQLDKEKRTKELEKKKIEKEKIKLEKQKKT